MTGAEERRLIYDDVPPSINVIASRGSHWPVTTAKKTWQGICEVLLLTAKLPRPLDAVHATASLRFPVNRVRDEGNFRWLLEKALGDALVNGGWLADDDPARFTFGALTFEAECGPKRTTIRVSPPLAR